MDAYRKSTFTQADAAGHRGQTEGAVESPRRSGKPTDKADSTKTMTSSGPQAKNGQSGRGKARRRLLLVFLVLLFAGATYGAWNFFAMQSEKGKLRVSGRIEGYETNVGAKIGGRVDF